MFIDRSFTDPHRRGVPWTLYTRVTRHNSETAKNDDFCQVVKLNKVKRFRSTFHRQNGNVESAGEGLLGAWISSLRPHGSLLPQVFRS